jgi:hypothetical protein
MSRRRQARNEPAGAQPLIGEYERAHQKLVAAEAQASAATRWWLLVPILVLLAPIAFVVFAIVIILLDVSSYYGWLAPALPLLGLLVWGQARLAGKMLGPRLASGPQRRELERRVKSLDRRLPDRSRTDTPMPVEQPAVDQLVRELEVARRQLIDINEKAVLAIRWRYVLLGALLGLPILFVVVVGIAFPLAEASYRGLLAVSLPLLVLLMWAEVRVCKRANEPEAAIRPRRRELKRRIKRIEHALSHGHPSDGAEAALRRQPTAFAQRLWNRFPFLGPSPEAMLRRLPEGTGRARLWFHRHIGWGVVAASAIAALILLIATLGRAAGWR